MAMIERALVLLIALQGLIPSAGALLLTLSSEEVGLEARSAGWTFVDNPAQALTLTPTGYATTVYGAGASFTGGAQFKLGTGRLAILSAGSTATIDLAKAGVAATTGP
ncbi:MAG: hypothetical protein AAFZ18_30500 [Myxococcota bacterium]